MKKATKFKASLKKILVTGLALSMITTIASSSMAVVSPLPGGGVAVISGGTPVASVIPMDLCDSTVNHGVWPGAGSSIVLDTVDKQEGTGSFLLTGAGTIMAHGSTDAWNGFTNGAIALDPAKISDYTLSFWVKTNNKVSFEDTCFDIAKNESITENVQTFWLKSGLIASNDTWTNILIPMDTASTALVGVSGAFDPANINAYRIRYNGGASDTLSIDNITILDSSTIGDWSIINPTGDVTTLTDCEGTGVITSWPAGVAVDGTVNANVSEGSKSVKIDMVSGSNTIEIPRDRMGRDVSFDNTKNQYLVFDLFCADKTKIDVANMQIALGFSSGPFSDGNNMTWWIKEINDGWNRYILPLNYTAETVVSLGYADVVRNGNGPVDGTGKKATNFFRAIIPATGATNLYLDNIQLITTTIAAITEMTAPTATATSSSLTINWTEAEATANGAIGGYILTRYVYDAENDLKILDISIPVTGGSTVTYTDTDGILPGTTYIYDIEAVEDTTAANLNVIARYASLNIDTLAAAVATPTPTTEAAAATATPTNTPSANVPTGDSQAVVLLAVLAIVASSSIILLKKKVSAK